MTRFSIPETYTGCKNSRRSSVKRSEQPCFVPGKDVPLPPYHAWTPLSDLPARSRSRLSLVVRALFCWSETAVVGAEVQWDWDYILSGRAAGRVCPLRQPHRVVREPKREEGPQRAALAALSLLPSAHGRWVRRPAHAGDALRMRPTDHSAQCDAAARRHPAVRDVLHSLRVGLDDVPRLPEILGAVSRSQHASLLRGVRNFSPLCNRCAIGTPLMAKPSTRLRTRCVAAPIAPGLRPPRAACAARSLVL